MKNYFEIFWQFLLLGLTSFGGPMAHLGYFRKTFVEKLQWLDDEAYAKIVALSQFLPGPSSSQVGFSIGLKKGGLVGGILASIAFTAPSFFLLYFLATLSIHTIDNKIVFGIISGLKLFAVVVVADATLGMFKNFCKTKVTIFIFILSVFMLLLFQNFLFQILVIVVAGILGIIFIKFNANEEKQTYIQPNWKVLFLFFSILIFTILASSQNQFINFFNSFYQIGSLVFGGGHVILPLIAENSAIDENSFLVGYALAQAVPGPMFTIASYLGAVSFQDSPFFGALIATFGIFLPGFLLILAFEKSFESYSKKPLIATALIGINASVVAILFAALCHPIIPSAISSIWDIIFVLIGFFVMQKYKIHILYFICFYCLLTILNTSILNF
jgi:chromate transporter